MALSHLCFALSGKHNSVLQHAMWNAWTVWSLMQVALLLASQACLLEFK